MSIRIASVGLEVLWKQKIITTVAPGAGSIEFPGTVPVLLFGTDTYVRPSAFAAEFNGPVPTISIVRFAQIGTGLLDLVGVLSGAVILNNIRPSAGSLSLTAQSTFSYELDLDKVEVYNRNTPLVTSTEMTTELEMLKSYQAKIIMSVNFDTKVH